jgi:Fe-S cluster assembly protein SufB
LLGDKCGAHTFPVIECRNKSSILEHEATTSKLSEEQLFYCRQRGITQENAVNLMVNGFAKTVMDKLPMEFATEAKELLGITLVNSIG